MKLLDAVYWKGSEQICLCPWFYSVGTSEHWWKEASVWQPRDWRTEEDTDPISLQWWAATSSWCILLPSLILKLSTKLVSKRHNPIPTEDASLYHIPTGPIISFFLFFQVLILSVLLILSSVDRFTMLVFRFTVISELQFGSGFEISKSVQMQFGSESGFCLALEFWSRPMPRHNAIAFIVSYSPNVHMGSGALYRYYFFFTCRIDFLLTSAMKFSPSYTHLHLSSSGSRLVHWPMRHLSILLLQHLAGATAIQS